MDILLEHRTTRLSRIPYEINMTLIVKDMPIADKAQVLVMTKGKANTEDGRVD